LSTWSRKVAGRQYLDSDAKSFLKCDLNRAHVKKGCTGQRFDQYIQIATPPELAG